MKIRCKHCGEFFCPSDESVDLISEGYISYENVNICDAQVHGHFTKQEG